MEDFIDFFKDVLFPFLIFAIFLLSPLFVGLDYYSQWQCNNFSEVTGRDTKYIHFDSCYTKQGDDWIRYDDKYKH